VKLSPAASKQQTARALTVPLKPAGRPQKLTAAELTRAVAIFDAPKAEQGRSRLLHEHGLDRVDRTNLTKLLKLAGHSGELRAVDVDAEAAQQRKSTAKSFKRIYDELAKMKASGALAVADDEGPVTPGLLQQVARSEASPRVEKVVQFRARLEALKLFTSVGRDERFRELVSTDIGTRFRHMPLRVDAANPPYQLPLLERDQRRQNALLTMLFDRTTTAELAKLCVERLGLCGDMTALPTLESVKQKAAPELAKACEVAIRDIQKAQKMTIVFAAMEVAPYASVGGLGSVMDELPKALARLGHRVIVIAPRHTVIDRNKLEDTGKAFTVHSPAGAEPARLLRDVKEGVEHYFVENGKYFSDGRNGVYGDAHGGYGDEAERYDFFSQSIPGTIEAILGKEKPDMVQLNDAHTGPAAAYLKAHPQLHDVKTVMAIHNLGAAYQIRSSPDKLDSFGFKNMGQFNPMGPAEFYGKVNFLKLGIARADAAIAVSRQYMREALEPQNGEGLDGLLRTLVAEDRLFGNMNGIDAKSWDPRTDPAIAANYDITDLSGKAKCKAALQKQYKLPVREGAAVVGVVSRMTEQKGVEDVIHTVEQRMAAGDDVQFVICGKGEKRYLDALKKLQARFPNNVRFDSDFTKTKERQILSGADLFLMPSRFEPCGLPQMYAMKYLTPPVVRATGGLEESVKAFNPWNRTGVGFKRGNDIDHAMRDGLIWLRSGGIGRDAVLRNCAATDNGWEARAAKEQLAIYRDVAGRK
jgi:starch synthase